MDVIGGEISSKWPLAIPAPSQPLPPFAEASLLTLYNGGANQTNYRVQILAVTNGDPHEPSGWRYAGAVRYAYARDGQKESEWLYPGNMNDP